MSATASDAESEAVAVAGPASVTVGSRQDDRRRDVLVLVDHDSPATVRVRAAGMVTAVMVGVGARPASGEVLVQVDGKDVRLFVGRSPLFRPLERGDFGADVEDLTQFLAEVGHLDPADVGARVTRAVGSAIGSYQRDRGDVRDGVFRPEYVAFAPAGGAPVAELVVGAGDAVVPGDALLELAGPVVGVRIAAVPDGESLSPLADRPVILSAGGASVALAGPAVSSETLPGVLGLLAEADGSGALQAPTDDVPHYGGAVLSLAEPDLRGVVPTSAVHGSGTGTLCVFVHRGPAVQAVELIEAPPVVGEIGLTSVPADLVGAEVVRDPTALADAVRTQCG